MMIRQLFDADTSTYTYLLADEESRDAVIIDPVDTQVARDTKLIVELGLNLRYTLDTHVHADHVTGSGALRSQLGARSIVAEDSGAACASEHVSDGDTITFGRYEIEVRQTPGHTDGCLSYVARFDDQTVVFTGDALLIRGCGRTDFQQGDAGTLYESVHTKLFNLPDDTIVYPGHDYRGHTQSTIGEEKAHNPRLRAGVDREAFIEIMDNLNLPNPRYMDVAVPANLACGQPVVSA